jgi:hypothetical protein
MNYAVKDFRAKFDEEREWFCQEVTQLKNESIRVSVEKSAEFMNSNEVSQACNALMIANPNFLIPEMSGGWNPIGDLRFRQSARAFHQLRADV